MSPRRRPPEKGGSRGKDAGRKAAPSRGFVHEWARSILVAVALVLFVRAFLIQTFVITSGSMENTLLVGDLLVVNRAALGSSIPLVGARIPGYSTPHRGDVIVFDPPPPDTVIESKLVKRLVGLPGDTLEMRDRTLYVNGRAQVEPYVIHANVPDETNPWMVWQKDYLVSSVDRATYAPTRDNWGPLVIPPDRYFMMGDNRENSVDSRYWGLVERWRLEGRPMFIYFSYNRGSYRPFPWLREIRWRRIGSVVHGAGNAR